MKDMRSASGKGSTRWHHRKTADVTVGNKSSGKAAPRAASAILLTTCWPCTENSVREIFAPVTVWLPPLVGNFRMSLLEFTGRGASSVANPTVLFPTAHRRTCSGFRAVRHAGDNILDVSLCVAEI